MGELTRRGSLQGGSRASQGVSRGQAGAQQLCTPSGTQGLARTAAVLPTFGLG